MTFLRNHARLAALLIGGALLASCDTRLPTGTETTTGGLDQTPPTLAFSMSAGSNNTVDIGTPFTVTVTAADNQGVETFSSSLNNGASVLEAKDSTLSPTAVTTKRTHTVPVTGLQRGDRIVVRGMAVDKEKNFRSDSIVITIADTMAPAMTMFSSKSGQVMKGGDSLDVRVSASDSSGMQRVGYRVYRTGGADSLTVVLGDSTSAPTGTLVTSLTSSFRRQLAAGLNIGTYRIVGFALDRSGLATNPGPVLNFTIVDGTPPTLAFLAPRSAATVNIGDSILIRMDLRDNVGLKNVTIYGVSPRGDAALGTADTIMRYVSVTAPQGGAVFRDGLRDTLDLRRFIRPVTPLDTITGKLIVYGIVTDAAGNVTRDTLVLQMTKGPNVSLVAPVVGDSLTRGTKLRISVTATSGVGVTKLGFDLVTGNSGPAWPTPIGTAAAPRRYEFTLPTPAVKAGPYTVDIDIPPDAPSLGMLTISPFAADVNGQPGAPTPQDFFVRVGAAPPPLVRQSIATRVELRDSLTVYASGAALTQVGYVISDALPPYARVDSNSVAASSSSFGPQGITFNLATQWQGKRVRVSSFARDSAGKIGWSVPATSNTPVTDTTKMARDTALVVYGRTYTLPASRAGTVADVMVDQPRGNVFLSNLSAGRLEVWQRSSQQFDANGIFVGSQPWGMALSRTAPAGDTLYVANSGGTNLSRVFIGAATPSGMSEDLARRIVTRISLLYKVSEARDASTGKIRLTLNGPFLFSDRPQYVQQSVAGRLYLSTRPTAASTKGTIRYVDPSAPAPDQRFVLAFATQGSDPNSYLIANIDNAAVTPAPANSTASDALTLCDHPSGSTAAATCATSSLGIAAALDSLRANVPLTDVEAGVNLDENSLGLTDTTYAAASTDGRWIAFGEGHSTPFARAFLLQDDGSVPGRYSYASPSLNVADLVNNASDQLYGLALDKTGKTLGIHGVESYFATVDRPFTQRLQGKATTFNPGAGIAFHPDADGTATPQASRLAFVASNNGSVEVVDIAYYTNRGTLQTKLNLSGPLRASLPFAGDDPSIILKLFGVSARGLVVIDVTAADIKAGP